MRRLQPVRVGLVRRTFDTWADAVIAERLNLEASTPLV
jgi:hypothetical protein